MKRTLLDRLVVWYIKRNFSHERSAQRNMILETVCQSMYEEFNEDNLVTRYSALIQWLLKNDKEYQSLLLTHETSMKQNLSVVLAEAVTNPDL